MKKTKLFLLSSLALLVATGCELSVSISPIEEDSSKDSSSVVDPQQALEEAVDYVKTMYQGDSEATTGDFDLVTSFKLAGVDFSISWSLNLGEGADANAVKLGDIVDGKQKVVITYNDETQTESAYTLVATVKDASGNEKSYGFKHKVPVYKFASLTEFMALADASSKDEVTVKGKIVAYYKDGPYLQNDAGEGFYAYGLSGGLDSMKADSVLWPIGTEVLVTGTPTKYNGQYEFSSGCKVTKKTEAAAEYVPTAKDITTELAAATSSGDKSLAKYVNSYVTIKGVTVGDAPAADADVKNLYYYFNLNGNQYYYRPYASWYNNATMAQFTAEEVAALVNAEDWQKGYTAEVTGILGIYNNTYYVSPVKAGSYEITSREVSDEIQVDLALEEAANNFGDFYAGTKTQLPANPTGANYSGVTYSYSLPQEADPTLWSISTESEKTYLNYVVPAEKGNKNTIKVSVTATKGEVTETKEYTVNAYIPDPISVKAFLEDQPTKVVFVQGIVTAVGSADPTKTGVFVLTDAEGNSIYSNNKLAVKLGDEVIIKASYTEYNGFPQLNTQTNGLFEVVSSGNDVAAKSGTALVYDVANLKTELNGYTTNDSEAMIAKYAGKYIEATGYVVQSGTYYNIAATTDDKSSLNAYYNTDIDLSCYVGKKIKAYGFCRGIYGRKDDTSNSYLNFQLQSVSLVEQADIDARYNITIGTLENGTIAAKDAEAQITSLPLASHVVFVVTPAENYKIGEVKVNGSSITPDKTTGEFTVAVSKDMEITATFISTLSKDVCFDLTGTITGNDYKTEITLGDFKYFGGNTNGGSWGYAKFGGKSATLANANPVYIKNAKGFKTAIKEVKVSIKGGNFNATDGSKIGVSSWRLVVKNANGDVIDTVNGSTLATSGNNYSEGTYSFVPTTPSTSWAAGSIFTVEFTLVNETTTNGIIFVSKVDYIAVED